MFFYLSVAAIALFTSFVLATLLESWKTSRKFRHVSWAGGSSREWWKLNLFRLRNSISLKTRHASVVEKYWINDQAVFIPFLMGDHLVLPPIDFEWMADQPDETLDITPVLVDVTQAHHTLMDPYGVDNPTHIKTVSRDLTRRLGDLTGDIIDELSQAIDAEWGSDSTNWKTVNPYETLIRIVARTSNRVFVGSPLCANPELIENAIGLANTIIPLAFLIRMLPRVIRPALIPLISYKNRAYRQKLRELLGPEVRRRLEAARLSTTAEKPSSETTTHNDYLQWTIKNALKSDLPRELDVNILVDRLLFANFAAIHTSTITITNAIFDLVSPPSSQDIIATLRAEADSILAANNGVWTKAGLSNMTLIDSALKESGRLGQLSINGFIRQAAPPGGLTAPRSGTFIPQGTDTAVPIHMMHRSPNIYPDPNTYKPFRFANLKAATAAAAVAAAKSTSLSSVPSTNLTPSSDPETAQHSPSQQQISNPGWKTSPANLNFTTTSSSYLLFGHGRHACPGRFFAANELKLLMAYVLQNYELEMLEERPERPWYGQAIVCPMDGAIRVRRRKK